MAVRVVVVDDQTLFAEALQTLLSVQPGIEVVGRAGNGAEAVALCRKLEPDVVLMDLRMPVVDGITATRELHQAGLPCRVIALTTFDDDDSVFEALRAGAVGYLLKDAGGARLVDTIHAAARGETLLAPAVATKVVTEFARLSRAAAPPATRIGGLSHRESEVLRLVARGASNKDIANALGIAEGTVKNHMTSILEKLAVADRTQAALKARDIGMA
jgi:DNA-binding NarL/FixJ family response regulator